MKKYLFFLIIFFGVINLFAQLQNSDTTLVINKHKFRFIKNEIDSERVKLSIKRDSKIIYTENLDAEGLAALEFPDFDKDGNKDLMLIYMGNNFTYYLYLFDKKSNTFKRIEGFERFPESIQIKTNSKYYYSYHRAGCADMNWVSDLFYIENFKTIHIAHIYGNGCETKEDPLKIEIYKVYNNKEENKKLFKTLPYLKNIPSFGDKWDFIEKYWNANYNKFKV
jgi:hypothetical protein